MRAKPSYSFVRKPLPLIVQAPMALVGWVLMLWVMGAFVLFMSQGGRIWHGTTMMPRTIDIVVHNETTVRVDGVDIQRDDLEATLKSIADGPTKVWMVVRLYGMRDVPYGRVVSVLEGLRAAGFSRVMVMSGARP